MGRDTLNPLSGLREAELESVAHIAERLFAGRPLYDPGPRPTRQRAGGGAEFYDYREYVAGDDPRNVDWRATARGDQVLLKRYHEEASSDWLICLDRSASMASSRGSKWRLAAELAAALSYVLLALSNRVGLALFSASIDAVCPLGRGQRHYATVLETLVARPPEVRGGDSDLGVCARIVKPGTSVIVVSDFLVPDGFGKGLARLATIAGRVHAFQLAAHEDLAIAAPGPVTFVDAESGQEFTFLADAGAGEAARATWQRHHGRLAGFCRGRGIHLTAAWTDTSWKDTLLDHLRRFGGRRA